MPESVDLIDDRIAELDIFSYQEVNYISLYCFLSFFIICLTVKTFLTDFEFFFFFFFTKILSLSLPLCLKLPLAGTYTKRKPYLCYISQARLNHYYIIFLRLGLCSIYGTPALARVSGFVRYTELPPFKG